MQISHFTLSKKEQEFVVQATGFKQCRFITRDKLKHFGLAMLGKRKALLLKYDFLTKEETVKHHNTRQVQALLRHDRLSLVAQSTCA